MFDTEIGEELDFHDEGEILIRNVLARFKDYKDDNCGNCDFESGQFRTGDYGYIDEDRTIYVVECSKELTKVGEGYRNHVPAKELESVLFQHPVVSSFVVVGVRDTDLQVRVL